MLAIEIRDRHVLFVEGKANQKKITVKKVLSAPYDIHGVTGHGIEESEAFTQFISDCIHSNRFKDTKDVTVCFNQTNSIFREIRVPAVNEKKLAVLVRAEMINALNLSQDYLVDFVILDESFEDEGHYYTVLAVALQEDYYRSYMQIFNKVGLKVKVADFSANAMIKMMEVSNHLHVNELSIVLNVSKETLRMYLFNGFEYVFARTVTLNEEEEFEAAVIDNLNKMIQFTYTRVNANEYTQVILTGDDELFSVVSEAIAESLKIKCLPYQLPVQVVNQTKESLAPYVHTIGAMMRRG